MSVDVSVLAGFGLLLGHLVGDFVLQGDWQAANKAKKGWVGTLACAVHCTLYTLAVFVFAPWLPLWGFVACWVLHYMTDRYRLAYWWMTRLSGQEVFATGYLAPWSQILVDQIWHLLCLYVLGMLAIGG